MLSLQCEFPGLLGTLEQMFAGGGSVQCQILSSSLREKRKFTQSEKKKRSEIVFVEPPASLFGWDPYQGKYKQVAWIKHLDF